MADEIGNAAASSAQEAEQQMQMTVQLVAALFGSAIAGLVQGSQALMIDSLKKRLDAANLKARELEEMLAKQQKEAHKDAEDLEKEYTENGCPEDVSEKFEKAGLPAPTPQQAAIEVANAHWLEKYGNTVGFVNVQNRNADLFEHALSKEGIGFSMLPVQNDVGTSLYLVKGSDLKRIQGLHESIDAASLEMSVSDARAMFSGQYIKKIDGLTEPQCQHVKARLSEKDIPSMIRHDNDGHFFLIAKVQDIENNREYFNKAMGEALVLGNHPVALEYNKLLKDTRAAFKAIRDVGNGDLSRDHGVIYDAYHPGNALEFKKGGILEWQNEKITGTIDTSTKEGRDRTAHVYHDYRMPVYGDYSFRELQEKDYREVTKPAVLNSYLERRKAMQERLIEMTPEQLEHEKAEHDYQLKVSRNTDNATTVKGASNQMKYNPAQSVSEFIMIDYENDSKDDALLGEMSVIDDLRDSMTVSPDIQAKELKLKIASQEEKIEEGEKVCHDEDLGIERAEAAQIETRKKEIDKDIEKLNAQEKEASVQTTDLSDIFDKDEEEEEEEELSDSDFEDNPF